MKIENFNINNIPAVLYGENSESSYIFVHGQGGNKFEAERFARFATLKAEGEKKSRILVSEGEKQSAILRAEADKESVSLVVLRVC